MRELEPCSGKDGVTMNDAISDSVEFVYEITFSPIIVRNPDLFTYFRAIESYRFVSNMRCI